MTELRPVGTLIHDDISVYDLKGSSGVLAAGTEAKIVCTKTRHTSYRTVYYSYNTYMSYYW